MKTCALAGAGAITRSRTTRSVKQRAGVTGR